MRITHHGGGCCGIKQICMLGCSPDDVMYKTAAPEHLGEAKGYARRDADGRGADSTTNIYWFERPTEKAGERFDAYLEFLKKYRPCSLVEVTIVPYEDSAKDDDEEWWEEYQKTWIPFLKKRGFKRVAKFANSNSGNHIEVYHLILEDSDWDFHSYDNSYYDLCDHEDPHAMISGYEGE